MQNVTKAGSIALPVQDVTLVHLKDDVGAAAIIRCEAVDETVMAEVFGLPGVVDAQAIKDADQRHVGYLLESGPTLIHLATALRGEREGEWIRPAFHADDAHAARDAEGRILSVPWRMLRFEDKAIVVEAILQCSGYGGAAQPTFLVRKRDGRKNGAGNLASRRAAGRKPKRRAPRS